jgi:DNA-binding transcriptional LysR family regulator
MAGPSGNGLTAALLFSEHVYLATPTSAAADDLPAASLADYSGSDWVLPHVRWSCHEMIQRACGAAGFSPHIVSEISDFAAILALVGAGAGVAPVPEPTIAQVPANVTVRPLNVPAQGRSEAPGR